MSISPLLEVSGETMAVIARDLWVLIETNQENRGFKRACIFFFLKAIAFVTEARKGENW